jgi:hypothetical protein
VRCIENLAAGRRLPAGQAHDHAREHTQAAGAAGVT